MKRKRGRTWEERKHLVDFLLSHVPDVIRRRSEGELCSDVFRQSARGLVQQHLGPSLVERRLPVTALPDHITALPGHVTGNQERKGMSDSDGECRSHRPVSG
eukprot:967780-Rhodomonas_salina.5